MPYQVQDTTMKTETGEADPDHNLIFKSIAAPVVAILTEAAQGHNTRIDAATIGAVHDDHIPPLEATAIDHAATHHIDHIADHPYIEVLQLTNPEIAVDHAHDLPTYLQGRTHTDQVHIPADHEESHTSRRT